MTMNTDPGPSFPGTGVTADDGASTGTAGGDRLRTTASGSTVGHDRIRWDAVWAGALTTLATYLTLELLFFALGGLDLGADAGGGTTEAAVSGVLALVAFFLGGAATGGSAPWHRADDGMVNGVVAWAVTVVALLALALLGGGVLLGSLASVVTQFVDLRTAGAGVDVAAATGTARDTAGWTALGLGLTVVVSALGGSVGAGLRPGREERELPRR